MQSLPGLVAGQDQKVGEEEGHPSPERFGVSWDGFLPSCGHGQHVRPQIMLGWGEPVPPTTPQSSQRPEQLPNHLIY